MASLQNTNKLDFWKAGQATGFSGKVSTNRLDFWQYGAPFVIMEASTATPGGGSLLNTDNFNFWLRTRSVDMSGGKVTANMDFWLRGRVFNLMAGPGLVGGNVGVNMWLYLDDELSGGMNPMGTGGQ